VAVYYLRHGQSVANVKNLFAGQKDNSPLTEKGIEQAREAGKGLAHVNFSKIISSPLDRAVETARTVAEVVGFEGQISVDPRITEYDMGVLTSQPREGVDSSMLTSAQGAEDPVLFKNRVIEFLQEISDLESDILLVSHAGVGRVIETSRQGIDPSRLYDVDAYPNAEPVVLNLEWLDSSE